MIFLTGKVVGEDGTPIGESVAIQTLCHGVTRTVGYTDKKGYFSLQLDPNNNVNMTGIGDVTDTGSPLQRQNSYSQARDYRDCQLQPLLAGFTSQPTELGARIGGDNRVELGNIPMRRMGEVQGFTISATSAEAPSKARKDYEKGMSLEKKQNWSEAQEKFQSAVDQYPKYAVAWVELGRMQFLQLHDQDAKKSLQRALDADSRFLPAYQQLAEIATKNQQWKELAEVTDQMLRLNPVNFPQYWFLNAAANFYLQNFETAQKSAGRGLDIDQEHHFPRLEYLMGLILAQNHDYRGALDHLRNYVRLAPKASDVEMAQNQISKLEAQQAATGEAPAAK
jgi:tetratricopeptide (TPR) repeat protein